MIMLLLVQSAAEVRAAVQAASEFLVHQRQRSGEPRDDDRVLGIWIRPGLEAGLPVWPWTERVAGSTGTSGSSAADTLPEFGFSEASIGIRESFSLSGLWALCRLDGTPLRGLQSAAERRHAILGSLLRPLPSSLSASELGTFFPVFDEAEARVPHENALRELQCNYPGLVGETWFIADRERGIIPGPSGQG